MSIFIGRVRKFQDNIDTDTITPGSVLHLPMEEIKCHAFEPIVPDFYKSVEEKDVIVAGSNFGCGSSREHATAVLKELGIRYILCDSMARIYFRNCIALGIYPVMAPGVSKIFKEGDEIKIDMKEGRIENSANGECLYFEALSGTTRQIVENGGILPALKKIIEEK